MKRIKFLAAAAAAPLMFGVAAAQDEPAPRDRGVPALQEGQDAIPAKPGDGPSNAESQGEEQGFYRASEVLGSTVRGEGGEELGQVQDLLIDRKSQKISHFILDDDRKAGRGEQPREVRSQPRETRRQVDAQGSVRVVPWSVAQPRFTPQDRIVNVPLNQQRWQQAPAYTWGEIQAGPRAGWYQDVNRFYGVQAGPAGVGVNPGGRVEIERDGDVEIKGRRPGRPGRVEIDND